MGETNMIAEAVGTLTAEAAAKAVIERASPKLLSAIGARVSKTVARARVQFTKTFQTHLQNSFERSERIKTVISRDKPVLLENIYVPLTLESNGTSGISDLAADPSRIAGARHILSGTGGAGKTVLMKHLLNLSKSNSLHLVPLFIELRNVRFDEGKCLEDCIFAQLESDGGEESRKLFQAGLDEGIFVIYLDGFDEIHPEEASTALNFIKRFGERYRSTSLLITTRPKTGVSTLRTFTVFHVEPLNKSAVISLIEKTEFDEITKNKFLNQLNSGLFEKHQTLMSLPILVAMMLLAFRTYADIPDRMTVFYSQAFETLYSIHDSDNKELFKRKHHAGLAPDVFRSVLQTFCYLSLSNHDIEFTESTLNNYISRALSVSQVSVSMEKYRNDLIHNVCVLQPDGLSYVFVHRSFQEYFAALFALNYSGEKKYDVIDKIASTSDSSVAKMMLEIDPIKTQRYWLLPRLQKFKSYVKSLKRRKIENQMGAFFNTVWIDQSEGLSYGLGSEGSQNFSAMELLSACTGAQINFSIIVNGLKFPPEREIRKLVKGRALEEQREKFRLALIFNNHMAYTFEAILRPTLEKTNFSENFAKLDAMVSDVEQLLSVEIRNHNSTEESELFS